MTIGSEFNQQTRYLGCGAASPTGYQGLKERFTFAPPPPSEFGTRRSTRERTRQMPKSAQGVVQRPPPPAAGA